jgi:hypothetical protein
MNVRRAVVPMVCLLAAAGSAFAQHRVDPGSMYERIYAIVPMIGSGTWDDPKRPMFAPVPHQKTPGVRTGIIAFNQVESDDGKFALLEIVAANKSELAPITAPIKAQLSAVPGVQLFERGSSSPTSVQNAFGLLKKNFDITKFRVVVP